MTTKYRATITFDTKQNHPDSQGDKGLVLTDVYTINDDYLSGYDSHEEFMEHDLALVAGGGYETNTIENVSYKIERI